MSKFNKTTKTSFKSTPTLNKAGGLAFSMSSKEELVENLLTNFINSQFYNSEKQLQDSLQKLVKENKDKLFIAKAAIYARNIFGMRSSSHVVASELALDKEVSGIKYSWLKDFFNQVVRRPDDMAEILSLYYSGGGKTVPNSVKKGFKAAFDKFDSFQLSKFNLANKNIKLIDLINLVHPVPTDENYEALNEAVKTGTIKNNTTTSRALTSIGQNAESAEDAVQMRNAYWREVLEQKKLGYIDMIRSLTKIISEAPELTSLVCEFITNENAIKKNLIMPFTLYLAYKMILAETQTTSSRKIIQALSRAIEISCANVPIFEGETLVVVDVSGSMSATVGGHQNSSLHVTCSEIAALFAAILTRTNCCDFMTFSDNAQYYDYNQSSSVLDIAQKMKFSSGGTNFHSIFQKANKKYDRIIILSDMFGWAGEDYSVGVDYNAYCSEFNTKATVYMWNLATNGTLQMPRKNVKMLSGFHPECFKILDILEKKAGSLVQEIEGIFIQD